MTFGTRVPYEYEYHLGSRFHHLLLRACTNAALPSTSIALLLAAQDSLTEGRDCACCSEANAARFALASSDLSLENGAIQHDKDAFATGPKGHRLVDGVALRLVRARQCGFVFFRRPVMSPPCCASGWATMGS